MAQLQSRYYATARSLGTGARDLGTFQTFSGGKVVSESVEDRGPGEEFPEASGGEKTIEPVTIGRNIKRTVDNAALFAHLRALVGRDNGLIVTLWNLDENRNPYEKVGTWTGTLTSGPGPDTDSNSKAEHSRLELTMQPSKVA